MESAYHSVAYAEMTEEGRGEQGVKNCGSSSTKGRGKKKRRRRVLLTSRLFC